MPQQYPNPFKWLLLSQLDKKLKKLKWITSRTGSIGEKAWEEIFSIVDEINDISITNTILRDIFEYADRILNEEERLYVKVKALYFLSFERDILYPLYEEIKKLAEEVYAVKDKSKALKFLVDLMFASFNLDYYELREYIQELIDDILTKANYVEQAEYYSYIGLKYVDVDLSLSDEYLSNAVIISKRINDPRDKARMLAKIAYSFNIIKHNMDVSETANRVIKEALDIINGLPVNEKTSLLIDIAPYLEAFGLLEKYLNKIYEELLKIRDIDERLTLLVDAIKLAADLNLENFGKKILTHLINLMQHEKELKQFDKLILASYIARYTYSLFPNISKGISDTIINDIKRELKNKLCLEDYLMIARVLGNLGVISPNNVNSVIEEIINRIKGDPIYKNRIRSLTKFLTELKKGLPKKTARYINSIILLLYKMPSLDRIKIVASTIGDLYELDYDMADELLRSILMEIDNIKSEKRRILLLCEIIPNIHNHRPELSSQLMDYISEILETRDDFIRVSAYIKLANNYAHIDKNKSKTLYGEAINIADEILNRNRDKGREVIKKILLGIKEKLGDTTWYEQLKNYYSTLDHYV